jgi:hypothetical protein
MSTAITIDAVHCTMRRRLTISMLRYSNLRFSAGRDIDPWTLLRRAAYLIARTDRHRAGREVGFFLPEDLSKRRIIVTAIASLPSLARDSPTVR